MCASCAQRTLIGSIPRANILLYAELRKKQEENRKESTRRAARGTGGAAAQRHGAAAAASGVRRGVTAETRSAIRPPRVYRFDALRRWRRNGGGQGGRQRQTHVRCTPVASRARSSLMRPCGYGTVWLTTGARGRPPPRMHFSDPALMLLLSLAPWNASAALPGCRSPSQQLIDLSLAQQPLHAGLRLPPASRCFHLLG